MIVVRVVVYVSGLLLLAWTLLSVTRTVVLPRSAQSLLGRVVFRGVNRVFRLIANERRSFAWRDQVMALLGPIGLLTLMVVWVALVLASYMGMFWAVQQQGWSEAFFISGSSLLTLGFATADTLWERALSFTEATIGLGLVALLIAFLPALYSNFQRRERKVSELEVRAGTPPSAVVFVNRHHTIGWLGNMRQEWLGWEAWFLDLQESHTSYPAINFFRSPTPEHHWVTAAGTVLDAAGLMLSAVELPPQPEAQVCIRAGFIALRRVADFFGIEYNSDPAPDDPISISRAEFDEAYVAMADAGVPLKPDIDQAWKDWAGWRVNYDSVLLDLAQLTMAPYAPWTADRSSPGLVQPRLRNWGKRIAVRFTP